MAQIKKDTSLRKAILQAAITGQLISDVEDATETGKQLLDRIIEERNNKLLAEWEEALKKNPKAKKPAPVVASEIDEDEIPFDIPENWCWVRGKNIFAPMESTKPQGDSFVYIDTDAVNNHLNIIDNPKFLLSKQAPSRASRKLHNGDVLFSMVRPYLKNIAYVDEKYSTAIASTGFYVMTQIGMYNPKYLYYVVLTPYVIDGLHQFMKGDNSPSFNTTDIDNFVYPLPPLAVQNAIVAKLEQVLPLVDAYENAVLQKEELKSTLSDKVKKAILQEAITGKLTESWRKSATITESGKQLLDRIISERNAKALADWEEKVKENPKAKKPVPVVASEIEEEEIPFEVPEGWCWCRLGDVCADFLVPQRDKPTDLTGTIPWCRIEDIEGKYIYGTHSNKYVSEETVKKMNLKVNPVGTVISANSASIGAAAITTTELCTNQTFIGLVCSSGLFNEYLYYFLLASVETLKGLGTGTTIMYISLDKYKQLYIPLPPLEEQKEIVKKVEELLPLCKD